MEALERGSVWKAWEAGEILGDESLRTYMIQIMQEVGWEEAELTCHSGQGVWQHSRDWSITLVKLGEQQVTGESTQ